MTPEDKYHQTARRTLSQQYWGSLVVNTDNVTQLAKELEMREKNERIFLKHIAPNIFSPKDPSGVAVLFHMGRYYYNLFDEK